MKVLILGDASSAHIVKWVSALENEGLEVYLWSLVSDTNAGGISKRERFYTPGLSVDDPREASPGKLKYLLTLKHLKRTINSIKPDILHAHYLTSYGLLGTLTGFRPYIVSVWGTDIMSFPNKSSIHRAFINWVTGKPDIIQASGEFLRRRVNEFKPRKALVVNFGLPDNFYSSDNQIIGNPKVVTLGTIKSLEENYDIATLIKAFAILKKSNHINDIELKLRITGGGRIESALKRLADELGVADLVDFAGKVPYSDIIKNHDQIDIHVCPSRRESFGVSILEAMARRKPVVASDIPAFDELVQDGITGMRFCAGDAEDLAEKLQSLLLDPAFAQTIADSGFKKAEQYKMTDCSKKQLAIYTELLKVVP